MNGGSGAAGILEVDWSLAASQFAGCDETLTAAV